MWGGGGEVEGRGEEVGKGGGRNMLNKLTIKFISTKKWYFVLYSANQFCPQTVYRTKPFDLLSILSRQKKKKKEKNKLTATFQI